MKYFLTLLLMCIFVTNSIIAQHNRTSSIVYLQDGSVYVGQIIQEDIFEVVMKTQALDTITINKAFVSKTVRAKEIIHVQDGKYHKTEGLFGAIEMAFSYGNESHYTQLAAIFGNRMTRRFLLGGGIGLTQASINGNNIGGLWFDHDFVQVFAYSRYYINDKKLRLFGEMKLGWGFSMDNNWGGNTSQGGFYANPGIGIEFANRKKLKWSIKLSQNLQQVSSQENWGDQFNPVRINLDHIYNRTSLSVGIQF